MQCASNGSQKCCIELCAGCARLSSKLRDAKLHTIAIDHSKNRHKNLHPIIQIDLADDQCVEQVLGLVDDVNYIVYLHAAPPYGTCSRARERRIPFRLRRRGIPDPKPLRSVAHPDGLPNLHGVNRKRVSTSNSIYKNMRRIIRSLPASCIISIENPTRSHLWNTSWVKALIKEKQLFPISFQVCMHGGRHDKWTTFYVNHSAFSSLALVCDGSHTHLPWGFSQSSSGVRFHTADEAKYPEELCARIASIIAKQVGGNETAAVPIDYTQKTTASSNKLRSIEAGRQPRGNLLPQVVPEFQAIQEHVWPTEFPVTTRRQLTLAERSHFGFAHEAKLLSIESRVDAGTNTMTNIAQIGLYHTPEAFTDEALKLQHPFDGSDSVPDDTKRAIFWLLTAGAEEVEKCRNSTFDHYERLRDDLETNELEIHSRLDPLRRSLIEEKKVLLFKRMCQDAGVDDDGLSDILVNGVKLVGQADQTGQFPKLIQEPAMSSVQLMNSTKWTRKRAMAVDKDTPKDVKEHIWNGALDEVAKGWLSGPYDERQVAQLVGSRFVASRRFGLVQSDKVRAIDDMSESFVNASFGSSYKLDLPGIDGITTMARTWLESVKDDRTVRFSLSGGKVLSGILHSSFTVPAAKDLVGRTLDLDAAYKQLLTAKSSLWCSVLAIEQTSGTRKLFISNVLPFGSSASVYAFNRMSRALHTIGERLFGLVWSNYYDDYPQLDLRSSGSAAQDTAEKLFSLLGWKVSMKDTKRLPMSKQFDALGVSFDLSNSCGGKIFVRNKKSRIAQVCAELNAIIECGSLSASVATSLRGKLQFAETHTFGRLLAANWREVSERAAAKSPGQDLTPGMIDELRWAHDLMTNDIPRVISAGMASRKLYIFTDAALEENDSTGGLGAVAYYSEFGGVVKRFFMASRVPEDVMKLWQTKTAKIISTLELFAAVLAITQLSKMFKHIRVFVFVDNEAARASLISMKSSVCFHLHLLKHVSKIVQVNGIYLWIARVPSSSNPSDSPSRNVWAHLLKEGHARMDVDWCQLRHLTHERKTQVRSVMLRRFLTVCYVHVLRGV